MKRKKKDLNQHSWKVQYLTVSYRWFCTVVLVGDCRRSEIDAEITSGSDREVDGSTFDHRFLGSVWLGTMLVKERSSCFVFLRFSILYQ